MERKEVNFNGAKLLAVKVTNGKIYVSFKHICKNLGLSGNQIESQRQKITKDETLKRGCLKIQVGVFDPNNTTLGVDHEFLPIWLAKINPARFSKELKDKLLEYQLHAKDVLAAAFLDNKPKQLTLPKPKEHKIIKKYYNGVPVMSTRDLASITGKSYATIHYYAVKNKTLVHKHELVNFKKENPGLPSQISNITILYREEVINICKKMKIYNKVKPQILAYFDEFVPEPNIVSSEPQKVTTDQNMKAEKLLQVLPHIAEESLKSYVVTEVIRLIDNKILEEYENGRLSMRFIDNTEKIIEVREQRGYRMTVVETDKPIVECMQPGLMIKNISGNKLIVEKIK